MSVHLIGDNKAPRVRNSEGCVVLECGCAHSDTHYLQMCDAHYREWHALHESAHRSHTENGRPL